MEKRITKKENFGMLKEIAEKMGRTDLVEFIDHEIELIEKKAGRKVETATQKENAEIKTKIIDFLVRNAEKQFTITELQAEMPEIADYSNQKVSALVNQLFKAEQIDKVVDKKKSYFKAIAE